jgi:hypothetical protein
MFRRRSREEARVRFKRGAGPRELGDGRRWPSMLVPPGPGPSGWRVRAMACHCVLPRSLIGPGSGARSQMLIDNRLNKRLRTEIQERYVTRKYSTVSRVLYGVRTVVACKTRTATLLLTRVAAEISEQGGCRSRVEIR